MTIENPTITDKEKQDVLIANIVAREREIHSYQVNIDNYNALLKALPSSWPDELVKFRGLNTQQIAANVPLEQLQAVADLVFSDQVANLLKTEMIEQGKAQHVYNALVSQVDPAALPGLLSAYVEALTIK